MKNLLSKREVEDLEQARRERRRAQGRVKSCRPILSRRMLVLMIGFSTALFTGGLYLAISTAGRPEASLFRWEDGYNLVAVSLANRSQQADQADFEAALASHHDRDAAERALSVLHPPVQWGDPSKPQRRRH